MKKVTIVFVLLFSCPLGLLYAELTPYVQISIQNDQQRIMGDNQAIQAEINDMQNAQQQLAQDQGALAQAQIDDEQLNVVSNQQIK